MVFISFTICTTLGIYGWKMKMTLKEHTKRSERVAEREMCNSGQKDHHDCKVKREVAFLG